MPYARKNILTWQMGMYYHIYNRGARQVTIFREATNFLFTISRIKEYSLANKLIIIAYCIMPNHYHFLVRRMGMNQQAIYRNLYTKAYNKKYSHSGILFEGRFRAKVIQNSSYLLHLCRYIHGNPGKDGMVADPADWEYSNYLEWTGKRPGTLVDRNFIKDQFFNPEEDKKFVYEYLNSRRLPDDVQKFIDEIEK